MKSIISVDGAKPDVTLAKKYGMRYVHLPHGYNGISEQRTLELAKAVRDLEGPIYVHCHHGKHRSPTAAVVACVANGMMPCDAASKFLQFAGTSENYQGLYLTASRARQVDHQILDAMQTDFPEIAKLPPLAESMVEMEHTFDHLKQFAAIQWQPISDHPDLDPAHESLLLTEQFTELLRLESTATQPPEFRKLLQQSESAARELEQRLRSRLSSGISVSDIDEPFQRIASSCTTCHKQFRDVPLSN